MNAAAISKRLHVAGIETTRPNASGSQGVRVSRIDDETVAIQINHGEGFATADRFAEIAKLLGADGYRVNAVQPMLPVMVVHVTDPLVDAAGLNRTQRAAIVRALGTDERLADFAGTTTRHALADAGFLLPLGDLDLDKLTELGLSTYELRELRKLKAPIRVHHFATSGEAYNASQTNDEINHGDILTTDEGSIAILDRAWPLSVAGPVGEFHTLKPGTTLADVAGMFASDYSGKRLDAAVERWLSGVKHAEALAAPAAPEASATYSIVTINGDDVDNVDAGNVLAWMEPETERELLHAIHTTSEPISMRETNALTDAARLLAAYPSLRQTFARVLASADQKENRP